MTNLTYPSFVAWHLHGFSRHERRSKDHRTRDGVTTLCGIAVGLSLVTSGWTAGRCRRCDAAWARERAAR